MTIPTTIPRAALVTGGAQRLGHAVALDGGQHLQWSPAHRQAEPEE